MFNSLLGKQYTLPLPPSDSYKKARTQDINTELLPPYPSLVNNARKDIPQNDTEMKRQKIFVSDTKIISETNAPNNMDIGNDSNNVQMDEDEVKQEEPEFNEVNSEFLAEIKKVENAQYNAEDCRDIVEDIISGLNSGKYDEDPFVNTYRRQIEELVTNAYDEMWESDNNVNIVDIVRRLQERLTRIDTDIEDEDEEMPQGAKMVDKSPIHVSIILQKVKNQIFEIEHELNEYVNVIDKSNIFDIAIEKLMNICLNCEKDFLTKIINDNLESLQFYAPFVTNKDTFYKLVYLKECDKNGENIGDEDCSLLLNEFNEASLKCKNVIELFKIKSDKYKTNNATYYYEVLRLDNTEPKLTSNQLKLLSLLSDFEIYKRSGRVFGIEFAPPKDFIQTFNQNLVLGQVRLTGCLNNQNNINRYKLIGTLQKKITDDPKKAVDKFNNEVSKLGNINTVNTIVAARKTISQLLTSFYSDMLNCISQGITQQESSQKNNNDDAHQDSMEMDNPPQNDINTLDENQEISIEVDNPPQNDINTLDEKNVKILIGFYAAIIKNYTPTDKNTKDMFVSFKMWFLKNYFAPKIENKQLRRTVSVIQESSQNKGVYTFLQSTIQDHITVSDGLIGYKQAIDDLIPNNNKKEDIVTSLVNTLISKEDNQNDTLQKKLDLIQKQIIYKRIGLLLDVLDLSHDIAVDKPFLQFTEHDKIDYFTKSGQAVQHKLRKKREDELSSIVKICKDHNVALPDLSDKVLTKMQTHAYFYKFLVDYTKGEWLYKESGRRPDLFTFYDYYYKLNEEDKETFTNICMNYANEKPDNTQFDNIITKIAENKTSKMKKDLNQDGNSIYVPLWCISGFDGGGNVMTNASPSFVVFEHVYGIYKYSVFSNWIQPSAKTDTNDIGHLVIVTHQDNSAQKNILAVFCFIGKVTLNSLIDYANLTWKGLCVPRRGGGEDEGGGKVIPWEENIGKFMQTYQISPLQFEKTNVGDNDWMNALHAQLSNTVNIINATTHYFEEMLLPDTKQLLFFLNKTIGDKIFSVYPSELKVITTVDSLVPQSVLLHGLSGKINCIQEVWRKGRGGSTTVSPGVFGVNYEVIATSVLYKMVCYGFVCRYVTKIKGFTKLKENPFEQNYIKIIKEYTARKQITKLNDVNACKKLSDTIEIITGIQISNTSLNRIENAVDFLARPYNKADAPDVYEELMTYLSGVEHNYNTIRVLTIMDDLLMKIQDVVSLTRDTINYIYSLPDIEQLFAFNMDIQATENETLMNFVEITEAFPSKIKNVRNYLEVFKGLNPNIESDTFKNPQNDNPETYITIGDENITFWFFIKSDKPAHTDSVRFNDEANLVNVNAYCKQSYKIQNANRDKKGLYRIDIEITIQLLTQIFEEISQFPTVKGNNNDELIKLKSTVATMIIEFFDEQKEELITKYGKYGFTGYNDNNFNNELKKIQSAIIIPPDVCNNPEPKGGKRASTRGKKVVKKKHTKRDRKRVAHKKQTKKLRRKKHRTVNKRRARK
jgi:hypothetical protein